MTKYYCEIVDAASVLFLPNKTLVRVSKVHNRVTILPQYQSLEPRNTRYLLPHRRQICPQGHHILHPHFH